MMTDVKRMTAKDDFLKMPLKDRDCFIELYEECRTKRLMEECNCAPWELQTEFQVDRNIKFKKQVGVTFGAIEEASRSSKAIDERVILNFRDKNVVIARFRVKNVVIARFCDKNVVIARFRDKTAYVWMGTLPLKKRLNREKCSFATKQRMFGVFAIDEILRYRGTRFPGSRTLCHPACQQL